MHRINEHLVQPVWWQKQFAGVAIVHSEPTLNRTGTSEEAGAGRETTCVAQPFMTRG